MSKKKWQVVLILGVVLGAILILSISLPNMEFREARGLAFDFGTERQSPFDNNDGATSPINPLLGSSIRMLWMISVTSALLYTIFFKDGRKGLPRVVGEAIAFAVILFAWLRIGQILTNFAANQSSEGEALKFIEQTPTSVVVTVSASIALFLVAVGWYFYRHFISFARPKDDIARSAQQALADLDSGDSFQDVIIRCYAAMTTAVESSKNFSREEFLTPREFENRLVQRLKLPKDEVKRLTRLFEQVRYGGQEPGDWEYNEARLCLEAIIEACTETEKPRQPSYLPA